MRGPRKVASNDAGKARVLRPLPLNSHLHAERLQIVATVDSNCSTASERIGD